MGELKEGEHEDLVVLDNQKTAGRAWRLMCTLDYCVFLCELWEWKGSIFILPIS